jgi:hypothetical protein
LVADILVDGTRNVIDCLDHSIFSHNSPLSSLAGWKSATS